MARKKKEIQREPPEYMVKMWQKLYVMGKLTFEERCIAADTARLIHRCNLEPVTIELDNGKKLIVRSIDEMEIV